jgi:hypothetical protein
MNLLWAAGKLADFGIRLGLEPVPGVPLRRHPGHAQHPPALPVHPPRTQPGRRRLNPKSPGWA